MIVKTVTRAQMIKDAEKELEQFERGIKSGFWQGMGYTEQEIKDTLDLCEKSVAYLKDEIEWSIYNEQYKKVHGKKVV
jgi:hypothetical protein